MFFNHGCRVMCEYSSNSCMDLRPLCYVQFLRVEYKTNIYFNLIMIFQNNLLIQLFVMLTVNDLSQTRLRDVLYNVYNPFQRV